MMGGDKIHQAKVERFNMGQAGDLPCLMQCAGCFDQHMNRNFAGNPVADSQFIECSDLYQDIVGSFRLGQHDIGHTLSSHAEDNLQFIAPNRVPDVMDAHTHAVEAVSIGQKQFGDHAGMFTFLAGRRTIFAISGDIKEGLLVDR